MTPGFEQNQLLSFVTSESIMINSNISRYLVIFSSQEIPRNDVNIFENRIFFIYS